MSFFSREFSPDIGDEKAGFSDWVGADNFCPNIDAVFARGLGLGTESMPTEK